MTKVTHLPTGVYIEPNLPCDGSPEPEDGKPEADWTSVRDKQLIVLNAAVEKVKG